MKRPRICLLIFVFTSVVVARAEQPNTSALVSVASNAPSTLASNAPPDTITIHGIIYSNVTWRSITAATVTIYHSTGVAAIPLADLPPELQKLFRYSPQEAAAWQAAQQKAAAARADAQKRQALLKKYTSQDVSLSLGAIGRLGNGWSIFQVLDARSVLLRQLILPGPFQHGPPSWSSPVCLRGLPTTGCVDGQGMPSDWGGTIVKVTDTMTYESQDGQATVFVLEPYDGR